jgi:hypothetical protein
VNRGCCYGSKLSDGSYSYVETKIMQKLFSKSALFSLSLLLAACGDVNLGAEKTDGGDAAAGAAGSGGILGTGGTALGSGGLSGTGGQTVGSGGMVGTGGTAVGSGGILGTGGISGTGGKGSGGVLGSGGTCSNKCANDASESDSQDSSTPQTCTYNGRIYPDSTSWMAPDGCNECTCLAGHAGCTLVACADGGYRNYTCGYDGKSYVSGATFPSTDGCNICECGFYWYRDNPPGAIFVSCTSRDCSTPPLDAGSTSDGGTGACVYNGKTYPADTYFPSADGCDECHCRTDGQITCTFQHIGCRRDAGTTDGTFVTPDVAVLASGRDAGTTDGAFVTPDVAVLAPGCDIAAAQAEMTARGLVLAGFPETLNLTLPSPISGPDWGLKSIACQDGGYDISSLAGQTVCLVKQPIVPACDRAPYLAWTVMSEGTVKCVYRSNDSTPGIFAVDGGYACP